MSTSTCCQAHKSAKGKRAAETEIINNYIKRNPDGTLSTNPKAPVFEQYKRLRETQGLKQQDYGEPELVFLAGKFNGNVKLLNMAIACGQVQVKTVNGVKFMSFRSYQHQKITEQENISSMLQQKRQLTVAQHDQYIKGWNEVDLTSDALGHVLDQYQLANLGEGLDNAGAAPSVSSSSSSTQQPLALQDLPATLTQPMIQCLTQAKVVLEDFNKTINKVSAFVDQGHMQSQLKEAHNLNKTLMDKLEHVTIWKAGFFCLCGWTVELCDHCCYK